MNTLGDEAEQVAAKFLERHGLKLLSNNYRCKFGEIDLVMQDSEMLVFVEVRLRSNASFGGGAASITKSKQQKLIRTAEHYLQQHGNSACRFDAIVMSKAEINNIEWIRNAFDA